MRLIVAIAALLTVLSTSAEARHAKHHHHVARAPHVLTCVHNTIKVSTAYGINICVDPTYASRFQAFFTRLHATGARVTSIICQAYGHAPGSNHIGGGACDVNQSAKNRTIPAMYRAGSLIRAAGLYDGCAFRDCGHIEAMRGLGNYGGGRTLSARSKRRQREETLVPVPNDYMSRMGASN